VFIFFVCVLNPTCTQFETSNNSFVHGFNFDSGRTGLIPRSNIIILPSSNSSATTLIGAPTHTPSIVVNNDEATISSAQRAADMSWWRAQAAQFSASCGAGTIGAGKWENTSLTLTDVPALPVIQSAPTAPVISPLSSVSIPYAGAAVAIPLASSVSISYPGDEADLSSTPIVSKAVVPPPSAPIPDPVEAITSSPAASDSISRLDELLLISTTSAVVQQSSVNPSEEPTHSTL
jgi:hypothetical protein